MFRLPVIIKQHLILLVEMNSDNVTLLNSDECVSDEDGTLLNKYQAHTGVVVCAIGSSLLIVSMVTMPTWCDTSGFLHTGPSDRVHFAGVPISNWTRWGVVIAYSVLSQVSQSLVSATISPWMTNVIRDHKTPYHGSWCTAQTVITLYNLFSWLVAVLDTFLWITSQLQYLAPALVTDLIIGMFTTHNYLARKHKQLQLFC